MLPFDDLGEAPRVDAVRSAPDEAVAVLVLDGLQLARRGSRRAA